MVITKNIDNITFDLVEFEFFIQTQPFDNGTTYTDLKFSVLQNCCADKETIYDGKAVDFLNHETLTVSNNNLVIPTTDWEEDVYTFIFKFYNDEGSFVEKKYCFFFEKDLACRIADSLYIGGNTLAASFYEILIRGNECECNCNSLCYIYQQTLKYLDGQGECNC